MTIKHYPGLCDCCHRHGTVGVGSSGYIPMSFGWCLQCLREKTHPEPEWVLAYLYWEVGTAGEGLREDEELPGTFRDGRYWTWREWADRFAKEWEPPPTHYSSDWTGRIGSDPPQWLWRLAFSYDCEQPLERWRAEVQRFVRFWYLCEG